MIPTQTDIVHTAPQLPQPQSAHHLPHLTLERTNAPHAQEGQPLNAPACGRGGCFPMLCPGPHYHTYCGALAPLPQAGQRMALSRARWQHCQVTHASRKTKGKVCDTRRHQALCAVTTPTLQCPAAVCVDIMLNSWPCLQARLKCCSPAQDAPRVQASTHSTRHQIQGSGN